MPLNRLKHYWSHSRTRPQMTVARHRCAHLLVLLVLLVLGAGQRQHGHPFRLLLSLTRREGGGRRREAYPLTCRFDQALDFPSLPPARTWPPCTSSASELPYTGRIARMGEAGVPSATTLAGGGRGGGYAAAWCGPYFAAVLEALLCGEWAEEGAQYGARAGEPCGPRHGPRHAPHRSTAASCGPPAQPPAGPPHSSVAAGSAHTSTLRGRAQGHRGTSDNRHNRHTPVGGPRQGRAWPRRKAWRVHFRNGRGVRPGESTSEPTS
jgi:hypothetical protein